MQTKHQLEWSGNQWTVVLTSPAGATVRVPLDDLQEIARSLTDPAALQAGERPQELLDLLRRPRSPEAASLPG